MTPLEFAAKRYALGIGQVEASKQLGVNRRTITRWETNGTPSVAAVAWITGKYNTMLDYLDHVVATGGEITTEDPALRDLTDSEKTAYITAAALACHGAKITPQFS